MACKNNGAKATRVHRRCGKSSRRSRTRFRQSGAGPRRRWREKPALPFHSIADEGFVRHQRGPTTAGRLKQTFLTPRKPSTATLSGTVCLCVERDGLDYGRGGQSNAVIGVAFVAENFQSDADDARDQFAALRVSSIASPPAVAQLIAANCEPPCSPRM